MHRSPADILTCLRAQLDHDHAVGDVLSQPERTRVDAAVELLAALVDGTPWPTWADPPQGWRSPRMANSQGAAAHSAPEVQGWCLGWFNNRTGGDAGPGVVGDDSEPEL